jgi:DNA-binding CsgD family transcriptional regulator
LCVFAGRFTLDDVQAVCCCDGLPATQVLDHLSSLLDKSLVSKEDVPGAACYRLHETMREFARLKLREAGEEALVERRCTEHYLSRCQRFAVEGRYRLLAWLPWMELQIDNIRAVLRRSLDQGDTGQGIELATYLMRYWITRATTEGVRWLDELLTADAEPATQPGAYYLRGFLAVLQSDPAAAVPALELGVTAARAQERQDALSRMLAMASIAATLSGARTSASRLLAEAAAVADGVDDPSVTLMLCQARALNGLLDGDLDVARSAATEGAQLSREAGDVYSLEMMLMNQALAAVMSGDLRQCERLSAEGLRIAQQLDDRVAQCYLLGALGCCAAGSGEPKLAAQLLGATENLRAEAGASIHAGLAPALARATKSATVALGAAKFEAEFTAGRHLTRVTAARIALREVTAATVTAQDSDGAGILGRREVDVARLVADGLSNKEIGARLFISERTVESHVRNTLNKLGFNSRAQIAGWIATANR